MSATSFIHHDTDTALALIDKVQCVLVHSPDGRIVSANPCQLELCGYQQGELIGQPHSILLDPADPASRGQPDFWARLRAGEAQTGEFQRVARDGSSYWIRAVYSPVRNAAGQVDQIVMLGTDITAAKIAAQAALGKLQALGQAQALIEFSPQGQILGANDNFLAMTGYRLDDIVGRHHRLLVPQQDAEGEDYRLLWNRLSGGVSISGEYRRVRADGSTVWIHGSYVPVTDAWGRIASVLKLVMDVTERRAAVDSLIAGLGSLSRGNLGARLGPEVGGEFGPVRETFNGMMTGFRDMVLDVRSRTNAMNSESEAIAIAAGELARRGEAQAASMEQTAAAVEQISGNIAMTSQAARDADAAARDALQVVLKGAEVVSQAIEAIERIDQHTRQMGEFTRVIEGFAFQTNLLSINAAVEAARAGEVGRGFAVVANEVRNLAQQSAKASQNIADLIGKSETEVKAGVRLVRDAGISLDQIQAAVSGVVQNITGIAHATTEQSHGVHEVSEALSQLDGVNQANLSMSGQYAAAAAALSSQVDELGRLMGHFRTAEARLTGAGGTEKQEPGSGTAHQAA